MDGPNLDESIVVVFFLQLFFFTISTLPLTFSPLHLCTFDRDKWGSQWVTALTFPFSSFLVISIHFFALSKAKFLPFSLSSPLHLSSFGGKSLVGVFTHCVIQVQVCSFWAC
ncbi:hypothetical protein Drorol1_Dr00012859 [Drosera rotundifolia]